MAKAIHTIIESLLNRAKCNLTITAYQQNGVELPMNLKFCLEGMEESGSEGLDEVVLGRKDFFGQD